MPYTPDKPRPAPPSDELRARIPGWGVDLDPADRPAVPKERFDPDRSGARWDFPDRQPERLPRERSVEHQMLTPVFGTTCPPKGLSGVIRRYSYRRYSEARAAHWLLLIAADRIDTAESRLRSLLTGRPDNLVAETGVSSELSHRGLTSRLHRGRADQAHHLLDPVIVALPWILAVGVGYVAVRRVAHRRR